MGALKWIIMLVLPLVLIIVGVLYLSQGLKDVSLESFVVYGVEGVNTESATIRGTFFINNPSEIPVPIKDITYDLTLEKTGERIGGGEIGTFLLDANEVNEAPFQHELEWVPTTQLVTQLATEEKVFLIVSGEILVEIPEIKTLTIPFSQKTDIKEYILRFAKEKAPVQTPKLPINPPDETPGGSTPIDPVDSIAPPLLG